MSTKISRERVAAKIDRGEVTVIEALPASYYDNAHLPGAINLPHDAVDELGYVNVFDYQAGKQDWIDAGLPTEPGSLAHTGGAR
jgi:hypothetical protein